MNLRFVTQKLGTTALAISFILAGCGSSGGASCEDECTRGERRCSAEGHGFEVCGDHDGDGCLEWDGLVTCEDGERCSNGTCGPAASGFVLTGGIMPAAQSMSAGELRLRGAVRKALPGGKATAANLSLSHVGFTSKSRGD
jgi:hypothetical protein